MLFIGNNQKEDQFDLHRICSFKEPGRLSSYGVRGLCLHLRVDCVSLFVVFVWVCACVCVCVCVCACVYVQAVECSVHEDTEYRCDVVW